MKVHIMPTLDPAAPDPGNGGIHRVVLAQYQKLAERGWEVVATPEAADIIHCHVEIPPAWLRLYGDKPFVVSSHGFYWTDGGYEWDGWCYTVNAKEMAAIRAADAVTGVSEWVAQSIRRNTMRPVRVIHNGVDASEWTPVPPEQRGNYVLWNKTRVDPICDTFPMNAAAALLPSVQFVSTFGLAAPNVELVGKMPYAESALLVKRAAVYLATTRETWGLGTLEAMAAGVPVVGYAFGGQVEFIEHGVDGWLVTPGDTEGLADGIQWALANRERVGKAAREKAGRYTLDDAADEYAILYSETYANFQRKREGPKVSVIVPAFNMGDYLDDTLRSIAAQTLTDWECIVVNDASPDPRDAAIALRWEQEDPRFRSVLLEQNGYLARARNVGIEAARGRYIFPLDADDQITPETLATLSAALDGTREFDIAYGGALFVREDGRTPMRYPEAEARGHGPGHSGWPVGFRMDWMLDRPGQPLPYASMYRREVWEHTGGYRERCRSSEDQDFWLRSTSYGFAAQMVTDADTLIYRVRPNSMSSDAGEGWEEHRGWYPWVKDRELIPGGAIQENKDVRFMPLPAYAPMPVAVVIAVGPGHERIVLDAIDSVDAQTMRNWECLVVNDTGGPLPNLPSWVRVIERWCPECDQGDRCTNCGGTGFEKFGGAAAARNAGIEATSAPLFLPLDADDFLQPRALEIMLANYMEGGEPAVIYSDFWEDPTGVLQVYETPDYEPRALVRRGALHAVTALTPRRFWQEVGGYREGVAWEDWAFAIDLAARGHCSRRVALPLFTYRKHTGQRRENNMQDFEKSKRSIMALDFGVDEGGELLACSRCPSGRASTSMAFSDVQSREMLRPSGDTVLIRYTGQKAGDIPFASIVDRRTTYRFSTNRPESYVHREDAEKLLGYDDFEAVTEHPAVTEAGHEEPLVAARIPVGAAAPAGGLDDTWAAMPGRGIILSQDEIDAMGRERPAPTATVAMPAAGTPTETAVSEPVAPAPEASPDDEAAAALRVSAEASALASRSNRAQLNEEASALGIENPQAYATKAEVAQAIIVFKKMMGR